MVRPMEKICDLNNTKESWKVAIRVHHKWLVPTIRYVIVTIRSYIKTPKYEANTHLLHTYKICLFTLYFNTSLFFFSHLISFSLYFPVFLINVSLIFLFNTVQLLSRLQKKMRKRNN